VRTDVLRKQLLCCFHYSLHFRLLKNCITTSLSHAGGSEQLQAELLHRRHQAAASTQPQCDQAGCKPLQEQADTAAAAAGVGAGGAAASVPQLTHLSVGWGWLGGSIGVLLQSSSCLTSFTAGELLL
jgi:hypothetical protein